MRRCFLASSFLLYIFHFYFTYKADEQSDDCYVDNNWLYMQKGKGIYMKKGKWIIPTLLGVGVAVVVGGIIYDDLWAQKFLNNHGYDGDDTDFGDDCEDEFFDDDL